MLNRNNKQNARNCPSQAWPWTNWPRGGTLRARRRSNSKLSGCLSYLKMHLCTRGRVRILTSFTFLASQPRMEARASMQIIKWRSKWKERWTNSIWTQNQELLEAREKYRAKARRNRRKQRWQREYPSISRCWRTPTWIVQRSVPLLSCVTIRTQRTGRRTGIVKIKEDLAVSLQSKVSEPIPWRRAWTTKWMTAWC